jgi:hypothetical protein
VDLLNNSELRVRYKLVLQPESASSPGEINSFCVSRAALAGHPIVITPSIGPAVSLYVPVISPSKLALSGFLASCGQVPMGRAWKLQAQGRGGTMSCSMLGTQEHKYFGCLLQEQRVKECCEMSEETRKFVLTFHPRPTRLYPGLGAFLQF